MQRKALITGATGLLGSWLTCELLRQGCYDKVFLLIRSKKSLTAEERFKRVFRSIPHKLTKKTFQNVEIVDGDITKPHLGLRKKDCAKLMFQFTDIFHSAAIAEFGLSLRQIRPANVSATRNLLRYADAACRKRGTCPTNLHHISTVVVAGDSAGFFGEKDYDRGQLFNNTYERSKFEAEHNVVGFQKSSLKTRIYRPAIITGDSRYGITTNFKMIYQPLHFLAHKLFSTLPAIGFCRHSLVPVDKAAEAISILSELKLSKNRTFHIVNPNEMTLDFFVDTASQYFGFKKPNLIPVSRISRTALTEAQWKLINPYVPYLNYRLRFKSESSNKLLSSCGFRWPKVDRTFLNTLYNYCVKTKFKPVLT